MNLQEIIAMLEGYSLLGNTALAYMKAALLFLILSICFQYFKYRLITKLEEMSAKTSNKVDDKVVAVINDIPWYFYAIVSIYIPAIALNTSELVHNIIHGVFVVAVFGQAINIAIQVVEFVARQALFKTEKEAERNKTLFDGLALLVRIVVWSIGTLLILQNLGFDVSSLVASLGVGGIAIALAGQKIVGDIFSAFSIYVDRPFEVGDFIKVNGEMGTIKKVGLKTTRLQTLQGEELIMPNADLTGAQIQNFKRMKRRRIVYTIGATYDTPVTKLKKIPKIVEKIFKKHADIAELDRVKFMELAACSLNFQIVFYINSGDYLDYANVQEAINFSLIEEFQKEKIEFAFPTQTIHIQK